MKFPSHRLGLLSINIFRIRIINIIVILIVIIILIILKHILMTSNYSATYGGTESRFTDGSVVVFFFKSSFCNWLRAHAIFSDRIYPQSNFFCQPGVVALAGSLSCYRKSNILNYLIGNVAGKYLVRLIFTRAFFLRFPDHLINVFEVKCSFLDKLTHSQT